jgi:carbon monoxide dehydrogenase subunit G
MYHPYSSSIVKDYFMDIEGTYTLQASPEDVWQSLLDRQVLLRTIPGIEQLEQLDKDTYAIAIHVKQAPLIGTYHGHVSVAEQHFPYHYRLIIDGEGRQSTLSGNGVIHLSQRDSMTIIAYKGTLNLGKLGTLLPTAIVKGTAKMLIQQFFTALADHLRAKVPVQIIASSEEGEYTSIVKQPGGEIVILPPFVPPLEEEAQLTLSRTPLRSVVHRFGLGAGDPVQEALWERRIQRIGIMSGLLLLVWIGTRLPRK